MTSREAPEAPLLAEEPRQPKQRKPIAVWISVALAVFWLLFGLAGGSFQGKLSEVQKNDNAAYLPATAESTKVDKAADLPHGAVDPGFIVYERDGGLTAADKAKIASDVRASRPSRRCRRRGRAGALSSTRRRHDGRHRPSR